MKVSSILKIMDINIKFDVRDEIEFDYLGLNTASYKGTLCTFVDKEEYVESILQRDVILLTTKEISDKYNKIPAIIVENPRLCFFHLHNFLVSEKKVEYCRDTFNTTMANGCKISNMAHISANNVKIGKNVIIEEFVSIKENTTIGDNCIIRAGSIIGGEGFEEKRGADGIISVKHAGGVVLEKNVEIQQNVCIDKAIYPWDDTVIGESCKLDNLIHVAHAVKIDKCTLIAASAVIGGRVSIGENVWIGPGATVRNNIKIGNNSKISIGSVVSKDVETGIRVTGNFAIEHNKFLEFVKSIR